MAQNTVNTISCFICWCVRTVSTRDSNFGKIEVGVCKWIWSMEHSAMTGTWEEQTGSVSVWHVCWPGWRGSGCKRKGRERERVWRKRKRGQDFPTRWEIGGCDSFRGSKVHREGKRWTKVLMVTAPYTPALDPNNKLHGLYHERGSSVDRAIVYFLNHVKE